VRKVYLVLGITCLIFFIGESSRYSKRVRRDEEYLAKVMSERSNIGKRDLVGRKLHITPDQEVAYGRFIMQKSKLFRTLSAKNDPRVIFLRFRTSYILRDILNVADQSVEYDFYLELFDPTRVGLKEGSIGYSWPGGLVALDLFLFEGEFPESSIAGVLAHEVAHIMVRNNSKEAGYSKDLINPFFWPAWYYYHNTNRLFGFIGKRILAEEMEADKLAVQYMFKAGYDPEGYLSIVQSRDKIGRVGKARAEATKKEIEIMKSQFPDQKTVLYRYFTKEDLVSKGGNK
jgi:hypothetical protein